MPTLAVLIDADNIAVEFATAILERARTWGSVSIVRLFGDFTANRHAAWCELARDFGYETVLQLSGGKGKNSTDITLTIHAMDLLHRNAVDGFCVVSNDRDFLPLAARLRGAGKRTYAICRQLDERMTFSFTEAFALVPAAPEPRSPVLEAPIVAAFRAVSGGSGELTLAAAGSLLRKHAPQLFVGAGKNGGLRKLLRESGKFVEFGEGSRLGVRLRTP